MHHANNPAKVISEMFRVARKGMLMSDHNNYAFGSNWARRIRMSLKMCGLLDAATFVKQGFKKQGYSEGDVRKILGENTLRVMTEVERVSREIH